jgi:CheY-like chemotaxis protein
MLPDFPERLRILIVKDHADNAASLAILLRMDGHDLEIAPDGPAGLEKVAGRQPDVVLLDLGLPGMSGYEVAQRLAGQHYSRRPLLIAVTGYGREEDRRRSAEAGIDLHLVKPVAPNHLCALLKRFHRVVGE